MLLWRDIQHIIFFFLYKDLVWYTYCFAALELLSKIGCNLGLQDWKPIRRFSYFVPCSLLVSFIIMVTRSIALQTQNKNPIPLNLYVISTNMTNYVPNAVLSSFTVWLWVFTYLYEKMNQLIKKELGVSILTVNQHRRLQQDFSEAVEGFTRAFGFQVTCVVNV